MDRECKCKSNETRTTVSLKVRDLDTAIGNLTLFLVQLGYHGAGIFGISNSTNIGPENTHSIPRNWIKRFYNLPREHPRFHCIIDSISYSANKELEIKLRLHVDYNPHIAHSHGELAVDPNRQLQLIVKKLVELQN